MALGAGRTWYAWGAAAPRSRSPCSSCGTPSCWWPCCWAPASWSRHSARRHGRAGGSPEARWSCSSAVRHTGWHPCRPGAGGQAGLPRGPRNRVATPVLCAWTTSAPSSGSGCCPASTSSTATAWTPGCCSSRPARCASSTCWGTATLTISCPSAGPGSGREEAGPPHWEGTAMHLTASGASASLAVPTFQVPGPAPGASLGGGLFIGGVGRALAWLPKAAVGPRVSHKGRPLEWGDGIHKPQAGSLRLSTRTRCLL